MTVYKIDGLEIQTSNQGRSGYLGVTFSPAWTLDETKPFIAMVRNPVDDPVLVKYLTALERGCLHLGDFSDSREAAYIVALYKDNPEFVLKTMYSNDRVNFVDFPAELYDLPQFINSQDATTMVKEHKKNRKKRVKLLSISEVMAHVRERVKGHKVNVSELRSAIDKKNYRNFDEIDIVINDFL